MTVYLCRFTVFPMYSSLDLDIHYAVCIVIIDHHMS